MTLRPAGIVVILLMASALAVPAEASLNLRLNDAPDIFADSIQIQYVAATDQYTARGLAVKLDDGVNSPWRIQRNAIYTFDLSATIDDEGVLSGGTLTIRGKIPGLVFNSGLLLTGTLTDFAFGGKSDPLEFLFLPTGGDAYALFGSGSLKSGIILHPTNFPGGFSSDFHNDGATGDAGTTPEPSSFVAWALIATAGSLLRWRQRRSGRAA